VPLQEEPGRPRDTDELRIGTLRSEAEVRLLREMAEAQLLETASVGTPALKAGAQNALRHAKD
jgi:hypothetical protein